MKEHPILFSGPMVRAILNGTKTQTRRICKAGRDEGATCPYGGPGDLLWVKEKGSTMYGCPIFEATEPVLRLPPICKFPRYMPRALSRITLRIVSVECQLLNEITEVDARAEGFSCRVEFMMTWDLLNAKRGYSWVTNPAVWRIEFERAPQHEQP